MNNPAFIAAFAFTAYAEQHSLQWVLPRGGTRGNTVEVVFTGTYLADPKEILFYSPGIKATAISAGEKPDTTVKARFLIAPDCPLGEHVLRLRTATQLTEAITFWVDRFPTVMETEKKTGENDTRETAQPIVSDTTVEGQILPGQGRHRLLQSRFREGQRISVEIDAVRLGTVYQGGESDLAARILDATGKELARNDDSALYVQDPILSIVAPRTGTYYIEIKQQIYKRRAKPGTAPTSALSRGPPVSTRPADRPEPASRAHPGRPHGRAHRDDRAPKEARRFRLLLGLGQRTAALPEHPARLAVSQRAED